MCTNCAMAEVNKSICAKLFNYMRDHRETALELYNALSGMECSDPAEIEIRETAFTFFLAKEGNAVFSFEKM